MIVESLAVGTELLLGQIVNTNAADIARRLADSGLTHVRQSVIGDNAKRMDEAIAAAVCTPGNPHRTGCASSLVVHPLG